MKHRFVAMYPLLFLVVGLLFLWAAEHEFQRRVVRDDAEVRSDLRDAGVSQAEVAALLAAHTKLEKNCLAYTQITAFINLIFAVMMLIPLYSRVGRHPVQLESA